jgi:aminopeptidase
MLPDSDHRFCALAEVIVRVGLNLQPGQPLLITDPYELQGVHPESMALAQAVAAGCRHSRVEIIPADPVRLRQLVEAGDRRGYEHLVRQHVTRMRHHLARDGAFLFLTGGEPRLFAGVPADRLAPFDPLKWKHLGPIIQQLVRGETQWTLAPSPTANWAEVAYPDLPAGERLPALWRTVFRSLKIDVADAGGSLSPDPARLGDEAPTAQDPLRCWHVHLEALNARRDALNAARHRTIRYIGNGTDLTLELSRSHLWNTTQLRTRRGLPFVANLPTEEIFTAPHRNSTKGRVRVARPVVHAGSIIAGIHLEFAGGRVVAAQADTGGDLLRHLLATDDGARRIGEVALVPDRNGLALADRLFHHALLDENATSHIALGDAYRFCSRAWLPLALNSSQIHVDLSLDARVELS